MDMEAKMTHNYHITREDFDQVCRTFSDMINEALNRIDKLEGLEELIFMDESELRLWELWTNPHGSDQPVMFIRRIIQAYRSQARANQRQSRHIPAM